MCLAQSNNSDFQIVQFSGLLEKQMLIVNWLIIYKIAFFKWINSEHEFKFLNGQTPSTCYKLKQLTSYKVDTNIMWVLE